MNATQQKLVHQIRDMQRQHEGMNSGGKEMAECEFRKELRDGIGYCENPGLDDLIERNEKLSEDNARLRTQNANLAGAAGELHEALCTSMYREKILRNPHGALMAIADACIEDIMSMTDQEIEDELRDMGLDPAEEAAKVRKIFSDTIQKYPRCAGSGVEE